MAKVIRGARVVPSEVVEAEARAEAILAAAEREAERRRAALEAELLEEARATARAEVAAKLIGIEAARAAAVAEVQGKALELAITVARRVVGDAVATEPERVRAVVEEATARLARAGRVVVRVHPDDLAALDGVRAERIADPSLGRGDCVVESDLGDVDARVETRVERVLRALEGALE